MELPDVQYATTPDGVSIAYQTWGDGDHDIVMIPNVPASIDALRMSPSMHRLWSYLGQLGRCVMVNLRGYGASDAVALDRLARVDDWVVDVVSVMDACGMPKASFYADAVGALVAVEIAARRPELVDSLWLNNGFARLDPDLVDLGTRTVADRWGRGELVQVVGMDVLIDDPNPNGLLERLMAPPNVAAVLVSKGFGSDISESARRVRARSVVAFTGNVPIPATACRDLAELLPDGEFVDYSDAADFYVPVEAEALAGLERFLVGQRASRADQRVCTVVFTDIVESTRRAASLGNARWRGLLQSLDDVTHRLSRTLGARVVKGTGDGHLVIAEGPTDAIELCRRLRSEVESMDLPLRMGLHTGTVIDHGDDVTGMAVTIAARVMSHAQAQEIMVSRTVADLLAGSGLAFTDRGEHDLKGVPGRWELFAVSS